MSARVVASATRCIACLQEKNTAARCPHCGYDERTYKAHPLYLKPRSWLDNHYLVGRALGQGGFGVTYVGWDKWLQRRVAIKEYLPSALATRDVRQASVIALKQQEAAFTKGLNAFIDEAQHLARFNHPHIVKVTHFFQANATAYMVTDYLEGETLESYLQRHGGCLSVTHALEIILPVLEALHAVHQIQLYHRDISSHNVFMLHSGQPVLIDFGAARYNLSGDTQSLDLVLNHGYSPLEQYSGRGKIGAWTDVYACGALLHLMLTGCLPPAATDRFADTQLCDLQTDYAVPAHIEQAINTALAIKPDKRFQYISQFKAALCGQTIALESRVQPQHRLSLSRVFSSLFLLILSFLSIALPSNSFIKPENITMRSHQVAPPQRPTPPLPATPNNVIEASPSVPKSRTSLLTEQLAAAAQQVKSYQFAAAYDAYQALLKQHPKHREVLQGKEKFAQAYIRFIQHPQTDLPTKIKLAKQGVKYFPQHSALRNLHQKLSQQQQRQQKITHLLKRAEKLMAAQHWFKPKKANAYQIYQQIIQLDTHNSAAQAGLKRIIQQQQILAEQACAEQAWQMCLRYAQNGLQVERKQPQLQQLKQQARQALRDEQQQRQRIATLTQKAKRHWQAQAWGSSIETYQQILTLQTNHVPTQQRLAEIAQWWAQRSEHKADLDKRLQWVERGLRWFPQHVILRQQQKQTQQAIRVRNTPTAPPPTTTKNTQPKVIFTPSF